MADVAKNLYTGQPGTSDTLLYTAVAAKTIVRQIHVANTTAIAATITLGLNCTAALAAANYFLPTITIPPNGTYDWEGWKVLEGATTGTIRALQSTASALTVSIDGVEQ